MTFPVNSYEINAQRVLKFEGLGSEWVRSTAYYLCKGTRAVTGFEIAPRLRNLFVPARITGFTRQPNTVFVKPEIRRGQC